MSAYPKSKLDAYRAKRAADRTPEPFGEERAGPGERPRLFVVQKHSARHLHYDLRLEIGGALHSWALPKGIALDPEDKKAAFETEDHPLEYADFEGIIPQGNYGAGAMIVWDRGVFVPLEDPEAGVLSGKLLFELKGYKLRGLWTLVRPKKSTREWLLMKKPPDWARRHGYADVPEHAAPAPPDEASILSGLTVEELREGRDRAAEIRAELTRLGAPRRPLAAAEVEVMKPETRERPFSAKGWVFELKYDGFRVVAAKEEDGPRLLYRSGRDATFLFPELARALAALPCAALVLDGEVVVLDETGRPSFQRLQKRGLLTRKADAERMAAESPATLFLFDLLAFEGFDLRPLPLAERKALLARALPPSGPLRYTDDIPERGEDLYREVTRLGLEGVVAKKAASPYRGGRSADWLKIRADRVCDFAVVGWSWVDSARAGIGALHLALSQGPHLVYAGTVGSGFSQPELAEIRRRLEPLRRPDPPVSGPAPRGRGHVWADPELVCEVRFKEWTKGGHLRQPVFVRLRDDKSVAECIREESTPALPDPPPGGANGDPEPAPRAAGRPRQGPALTNLDKVFWPAEGYTKGDLIDYYRTAAPWLLPYLKDRPLVLDRYPDGIEGKSFYQKNAPDLTDGRLRTVPIWGEGSSREIEYILVDDADALVTVANLGAIPLHVWSSRVGSLGRPDWSILDLDPKGAPFAHVVAIARALHALCDEIGLPNFIKTSGGSGLHVLLPLGAQITYEQSRQLAELLARLAVAELPALATTERSIPARRGRVYVDFLQNGRGKLLAGPLSVRPRPGAPVSTPLTWEEVDDRLDPRDFTIRTVPKRLEEKGDPLRPVLELAPDLAAVLEKLAGKL